MTTRLALQWASQTLKPQSLASSSKHVFRREITTIPGSASSPAPTRPHPPSTINATPNSPHTHFRITLKRSAIALPAHIKATLVSMGIHRRMQTVFHPHSPEMAGKILTCKELLEVQNVGPEQVRNKTEQRWDRKAPRGFKVVGSKVGGGLFS